MRHKECSICYEPYNGKNDILLFPCNHKFHAHCIFQNITHHFVTTQNLAIACPYCTQSFLQCDQNESTDDDEEDHHGEDGGEALPDDVMLDDPAVARGLWRQVSAGQEQQQIHFYLDAEPAIAGDIEWKGDRRSKYYHLATQHPHRVVRHFTTEIQLSIIRAMIFGKRVYFLYYTGQEEEQPRGTTLAQLRLTRHPEAHRDIAALNAMLHFVHDNGERYRLVVHMSEDDVDRSTRFALSLEFRIPFSLLRTKVSCSFTILQILCFFAYWSSLHFAFVRIQLRYLLLCPLLFMVMGPTLQRDISDESIGAFVVIFVQWQLGALPLFHWPTQLVLFKLGVIWRFYGRMVTLIKEDELQTMPFWSLLRREFFLFSAEAFPAVFEIGVLLVKECLANYTASTWEQVLKFALLRVCWRLGFFAIAMAVVRCCNRVMHLDTQGGAHDILHLR